MGQPVSNILTDVGTNELEVVEFDLEGRPYVINVAKVREIIRPQPVMAVPETHPCVVGVFRNREEVLPLVDLGRWLGGTTEPDPSRAKVVVAEFNRTKVGFLVHGVSRIHRVSWAALETPGEGSMVYSPSALGFMRLAEGGERERIVFLLDFERIVGELCDRTEPVAPVHDSEALRRKGRVVLVAEDSSMIRKAMVQRLEGGGFTVRQASNGEEAWNYLEGGGPADLLVSDIEMPRMDGHHLTKRVKDDPRFRSLPVVLYSSMIYDEIRRKGESVGADAQICKPDIDNLIQTVDRLIFSPVAEP